MSTLVAPVHALRPHAHGDAAMLEELAALITRAGEVDPSDDAGSSLLRARAGRLAAQLIRAGRIPVHLGVDAHDPIVTVQRTLAVIARLVSAGVGVARERDASR